MFARGLARAALLLAVLAFAPGALDAFAPAKAIALAACGAAAATWWVAKGAGPRDRVTIAAAVALAAIAASAWWARDRALAWAGEIEQREGLPTVLALAGLFVATRVGHGVPRDRERTLDTVVWAATLAAGYALAQFAGFDFVAWGDAMRYGEHGAATLRPGGTLGNPILLGVVLAPAFAIVTARLASRRGDVIVLGACAAVLGAALVATLSRGALLAALAGAGVAVALARPGARAAAVASSLALVPALAWSAAALHGAPFARFAEGATASSGPARIEIARAAIALWRERPWLGVGPDGFGLAFPLVQPVGYWSRVWLGVPAHAHSAPLQLLATLGALGVASLGLWAAFAIVPLVRALGRDGTRAAEGAALAALGVAACFNPLGLAGGAIATGLLALAASGDPHASGARRPDGDAATPRGMPPGFAVALSLGAACAVLGLAAPTWRPLFAAGRARAALEASVRVVDPAARAELARIAARESDAALGARTRDDEPWRLACDAHLAAARGEADTALARAHVAAALGAARTACELRPARAANHLRLAQSLAAGGADASEAFAAAERLAPSDALVLAEDARDALARGDGARAGERARRIVALYPEASLGYALAGAAALRLEDLPAAEAAFDQALRARWEEGAELQRAAVQSLLDRLRAADGFAPARPSARRPTH